MVSFILTLALGGPTQAQQQEAAPTATPAAEAPAAEVTAGAAAPEATPEAATAGETPAEAPLAPPTAEPEAAQASSQQPEPQDAAPPAGWGPTPPAEEAAPEPAGPVLVPTGSFFTRFELREGYDEIGASRARFVEGDAFFYRARLGLGVSPMDVGDGLKVSLAFVPQASGKFGTLGSTVADADLGLHEGYLRLAGSALRLDLGRFELDYGDALVIGNLGWHQTARSFDGARVRAKPNDSGSFIDAFFTVLAEGHGSVTDPLLAGDQYFAGVYADVGPSLTEGLTLDLYLLSLMTPATDDDPLPPDPADPMAPPATVDREGAMSATVGARAKQRIDLIDYRAEAGLQFGTSRVDTEGRSTLAYHADLEVGANLADDRLRVALEGLYASGDDQDSTALEGWNQLFPTGHKFLGLMDVIGGRSNVISGVLHLSGKATSALSFGLDGHIFSRPQTPAMGADGYAGSELDFIIKHSLGQGLGLRGVYGLFLPPDSAPSQDAVHYLEVELGYALR
ncbi:MAG: alginate export family protein [Myxococcales bacterium]|nr:alginate export family protein [Myxococcales bacterium]